MAFHRAGSFSWRRRVGAGEKYTRLFTHRSFTISAKKLRQSGICVSMDPLFPLPSCG